MAKKKSGWDKWKEKKHKEAKNNIKKTVKKSHKGYLVVLVLALAVGLCGGYFGAGYISRNDAFELIGQKVTELSEGEMVVYNDEGIKYISKGKDLSSAVEISTNMVKDENGKYTGQVSEKEELYIVYKAVDGRCNGKTLYRVFRASGASGG